MPGLRLQNVMSFNEHDVNRDQGGRFDNKVGTTADITLDTPFDKTKVAERAQQLLEDHGLAFHGWTFRWDKAVTRAGVCNYKTLTVSLSEKLAEVRSAEETDQVLLHEIAHALEPGHNHDRTWLRTARELGYKGGTTGEGNESTRQMELDRAAKKPTAYTPGGKPLYAGDTFPGEDGERRIVGFRRTKAVTERTDGDPEPTLYDLSYLERLVPALGEREADPKKRAFKNYPQVGLFIRHGDLFEHGELKLSAVKMNPKTVILRSTNGLNYEYTPYHVSRLKRVLQPSAASS